MSLAIQPKAIAKVALSHATGLIIGLLPVLALVWLAYDVLVAVWLRPKYGLQTITAWIQTQSAKYIAIPFLTGLIFGLVFGHLFGQF